MEKAKRGPPSKEQNMPDEIKTGDNIDTGTELVADLELSANKTGSGRDEQGRWVKGVSGNPAGAKPLTEEEIEKRKIRKAVIEEIKEDYKSILAEALPEISPALITEAKTGNIQAIKEIHDQVFGKAQGSVDITSKGKELSMLLVEFINGDSKDNSDADSNGVSETI
jgi:hypothetical protein